MITTIGAPKLTVVFVPTCTTGSISNSRRHVSAFLEAIGPGSIAKARVNPRKNVVALDASSPTVVSSPLCTTLFCGVAVVSYLFRGKNTTVGVIQDVDADITVNELSSLIISTTDIAEIQRFGTSTCVKIAFSRGCLPATVKIDLVRHPVRP